MLYTDTDSFFLQFVLDDLAKDIKACPQIRDAVDFSEIEHTHISKLSGPRADIYGGEVGYFKDETKGDPIVEFVGLRPKMYSFTVCNAFEYTQGRNYNVKMHNKHVANGISRFQIRRLQHEDYLRMYNGEALQNVVNWRIGSKLYQVRQSI